MRISILGAGVAGLTSAWRLAREGHEVRVFADRSGAESTSGAAGAIWLPYLARPVDRVATWGAQSYEWLCRLVEEAPEAGSLGRHPLYVASDDAEPPSFAAALPESADLAWVPADEWPAAAEPLAAEAGRRAAGAWRFLAPVVHPGRHLAWLAAQLEVELLQEPITDLGNLPGDLVVNCAGPRAGALVDDPELSPTLGQVVVAGAMPAPFGWADERWPDRIFYGFPRGTEGILGGCSVPGVELDPEGRRPWESPGRPEPRAEVTRSIVERWRRAGATLEEPWRVQAGWRPVRSEVRVEREGRILHNYGHGGAGFTLAYGCAGTVVDLARQPSPIAVRG